MSSQGSRAAGPSVVLGDLVAAAEVLAELGEVVEGRHAVVAALSLVGQEVLHANPAMGADLGARDAIVFEVVTASVREPRKMARGVVWDRD